jgi:hypothetical protein
MPGLGSCQAEEVIIHGKSLAASSAFRMPSGIRTLRFRRPNNDRYLTAVDMRWYQEIVFASGWLDAIALSLKILDLGPYTLREGQYRGLEALTLDVLHTVVWNRKERCALERSLFMKDTTTHICESYSFNSWALGMLVK